MTSSFNCISKHYYKSINQKCSFLIVKQTESPFDSDKKLEQKKFKKACKALISNKLIKLIKADMGAEVFEDVMKQGFVFQSIAQRRKIKNDMKDTYKGFIKEFLKNNPNDLDACKVAYFELQKMKLTTDTITIFKEGLTKLSQRKITKQN